MNAAFCLLLNRDASPPPRTTLILWQNDRKHLFFRAHLERFSIEFKEKQNEVALVLSFPTHTVTLGRAGVHDDFWVQMVLDGSAREVREDPQDVNNEDVPYSDYVPCGSALPVSRIVIRPKSS